MIHKSKFILATIVVFIISFILVSNQYKKHQNLEISPLLTLKECAKSANKSICWEEMLGSTLENQGLKNAFMVFDDLYKNEPSFVSGCHTHAHTLGSAAYKLIEGGQDLDFPPQTAYCGYGFYHGLTELLLQTKGVKEASKLCDSKKSQITQVLYDACYHGIGHGALSQTARNANAWGNPQKMIDLALNTCIDATIDSIQRSRCASGVFMELGSNYIEGKMQLASIKNDPLLICRQQQEFGKMDCYTQMNGVLNIITGRKLAESAKYVEAIDEDKYAIEAIITLAAPTIDITKPDYTDDIQICRDLQKRLHLPCIKGLVLGFMLRGQPGIEYEQAIKFCKLSSLSEDERESCYELLLRHSSEMYDPETMNIICSKVEPQHEREYCQL